MVPSKKSIRVIGPQAVTAVVTGATGQDGYYLVGRLLSEGSIVHATARARTRASELAELPGSERLTFHELDIVDSDAYRDLIRELKPEEFYNFAGQSSVSRSFVDPTRTWRSDAHAVQGLLEAIRIESPTTRFYQSSTTDMFGSFPKGTIVHDEDSPFQPQSPYAAAKAAAHVLCDAYRRAFGLRIACGILSNHESRRRPDWFLTRKVTDYVRSARRSLKSEHRIGTPLAVGNLAAQRDWGFAPDYVEGIVRITRQIAVRASVSGRAMETDTGANYRDYVLGSGQLHAVWQLIDRAFVLAGIPLTWDRSSADSRHWSARLEVTGDLAVVVDRSLVRPADPAAIGANPQRAVAELGWLPRDGLDGFLIDMLNGGDERMIPSPKAF